MLAIAKCKGFLPVEDVRVMGVMFYRRDSMHHSPVILFILVAIKIHRPQKRIIIRGNKKH